MCRLYLLAVLCAAGATSWMWADPQVTNEAERGVEPREDTTKKELILLQGTWKLVSYIFQREGPGKDPELADDPLYGRRELVIKGNQWTEMRGGKAVGRPKAITVNTTKSPNRIDLAYKGKDFTTGKERVYTRKGIYLLEGDTLKIVLRVSGPTYPTTFEDRLTYLLIWKRMKK